MATDPAASATFDHTAAATLLCPQCQHFFSTPGFRQFLRGNPFRHSPLSTFASRTVDCRFCRFLWNDDLLGEFAQGRKIHSLKQLLGKKFTDTWVVFRASRIISKSPSAKDERPREESLHLILEPDTRTYEECSDNDDGAQQDAGGKTASGASGYQYYSGVVPDYHLYVRVESEDMGKLLWESGPLCIMTAADDPCAAFTNHRPHTWDGTMTPDWAIALRSLLQVCRTRHPRCQPTTPSRLPSRVLRIESGKSQSSSPPSSSALSDPKVSLYVVPAGGESGEYVALSYCWGGPQPLQLTKGNLCDLTSGIKAGALPKTLQDAIRVTRILGFEYLWVDALCIIQDSPEDKAFEIARMCSIYGDASVTIAVGTASAVSEGFIQSAYDKDTASTARHFSKRYASCNVPFSSKPTVPTVVSVEANVQPATQRVVTTGSVTISPFHTQETSLLPHSQRGWTYQEVIVPRVVLYFGDLEPFVRCWTRDIMMRNKTCIYYSRGRVQPLRIGREYEVIRQEMGFVAASNDGVNAASEGGRINRLGTGSFGSPERIWSGVVEEYTSRMLSFAQDRPLAISGVIDYLAGFFHDSGGRGAGRDECYFGVWKSFPLTSLLWTVDDPLAVTEGTCRVPDVPSWSWMSLVSKVWMDHTHYIVESLAVVDTSSFPKTSEDNGKHVVGGPSGNEVQHRLAIECIILEVEEVLFVEADRKRGQTHDGIKAHVLTSWQDVGEDWPEERVFILVIARQGNGNLIGLVVTRAEETSDDILRRVGVVEMTSKVGKFEDLGGREKVFLV